MGTWRPGQDNRDGGCAPSVGFTPLGNRKIHVVISSVGQPLLERPVEDERSNPKIRARKHPWFTSPHRTCPGALVRRTLALGSGESSSCTRTVRCNLLAGLGEWSEH